jgi:hypothetical protein
MTFMLGSLAIITVNAIVWWIFYAFCMGMAAYIGWPLLVITYLVVLALSYRNLGNLLFTMQAWVMTFIAIIFLMVKLWGI